MTTGPEAVEYLVEVAALSDVGTGREHNEDCCGTVAEGGDRAIAAVADGVSSSAGGEVASQMAIEVLLRAYREESPDHDPGHRLYRAVQQANIEVYDRAIAVPELCGMATTLTAVCVHRGELTAVHVGDSRLYLVRAGQIVQLTKDHTVAAEKARYGLISQERARTHEDRCVLTRSVGRELIVNRDRTARRLAQGDALLLCSDGLYNVLRDDEMADLLGGLDAMSSCRALIAAANQRGTPDNVTAAVIRLVGATPEGDSSNGVGARLRRFFAWST
ncbi:MAG TPA: protein phosphatase 2C domain-containing protein [Anaeromyxobacteraceae bacterium]|nr:protein phosphatase 2C domain-containing protein [Anaeromyxobacteraceae bacterium]